MPPPRGVMTMRAVLVEAAIALAVLSAASWWGASYWNASWKAGRAPQFYQEQFEPAVMIACGKGFVTAPAGSIPSLTSFLLRTADTFSCADIPSSTTLTGTGLFQEQIRYLMLLVGGAWRVLGVTWSGLGPLAGLLFGASTLAAYGIFRLGMGRVAALGCTFGLGVSALQLLNLPHLRDYVKAPFTLALVFILGVIVKASPGPALLAALTAAYGVLLGVGYGMRTDLLIDIPPLLVVVFLFLDGGVRKALAARAAALAAFLLAFTFAAWPILTSTYRSGGCQAHVTALGLDATFTRALDLEPAPYDWGDDYADMFAYKTIASYAHRVDPSRAATVFCSHDYDVAGGRYLADIVATFPGDMVTRAYASVSRIAELPFPWHRTPIEQRAPALYAARDAVLTATAGLGFYLAAATVLATSAVSVRLAGFLFFMLIYFGGYTAIQFANRHHFHMEFMTWFAFGFLAHQVGVRAAQALHRSAGSRGPFRELSIVRAGAFAAVACAVLLAPLWAARAYQTVLVRGLLRGYIAAPREEVPLADKLPGVLHPIVSPLPSPSLAAGLFDTRTSQFLEVDVNAGRCGDRPTVTFRYDPRDRNADFSRTFALDRGAEGEGLTRVFSPVYDRFQGVEFGGGARPDCIDGVYRVSAAAAPPLEVYAVLDPRWERRPLFQRMRAIAGPSPSAY